MTGRLLPPALKFTRKKNGQVEDTALAKPEKSRFCIFLGMFVFCFHSSGILCAAELGRFGQDKQESERGQQTEMAPALLKEPEAAPLTHGFPTEAAWACTGLGRRTHPEYHLLLIWVVTDRNKFSTDLLNPLK